MAIELGACPAGIGRPAVFVLVLTGVTVLEPKLTTYAVRPPGAMVIATG
jgi:hypothetical protein